MSEITTPQFTFSTEQQPDRTIVHCRGRLIGDAPSMLQTEVKALIAPGGRIVLDLTDVTQMDSTGIGAIVSLYVSAKSAACQLELVNLGKQILRLFSMTNLLSLFEPVGDSTFRIP